MKNAIITIMLIISMSCLFTASAFAKAGYDNFEIIINDPDHDFSDQVTFKYECTDHNHNAQQAHTVTVKRYSKELIGIRAHDLICPKGFYDGHYIKSIIVETNKDGNLVKQQADFNGNSQQHAGDWVKCGVDSTNPLSCVITNLPPQ